MQLIPAIDLREGRCVRLYQGDFGAETRYPVEPLALAQRYRELGAHWLHVVDLDGARDGVSGNAPQIRRITGLPGLSLQVGGGLRDAASVQATLEAGVARAVVGSAAVTQPDDVMDWMRRFGADRITLAFDVRIDTQGVPCLTTHGWREQTRQSLWEAVQRFQAAGLVHVLCTDVSRDGALSGPSLDLYREAVRRFPDIRWQASGGIRDAADLAALAQTGVSGAISGRALLEDRMPPQELRRFLPNA